jgi:hypothetical protein
VIECEIYQLTDREGALLDFPSMYPSAVVL